MPSNKVKTTMQHAEVRDYYNRNTPRFLSYGTQKETFTIHRAVWGPGVKDPAGALNYVNDLILQDLVQSTHPGLQGQQTILDLGCGVGASLFYLAQRLPYSMWAAGVTISPVQALMAQKESAARQLIQRCVFIEANFLALPFGQDFEAAFAVEAFAHAEDPVSFFQSSERVLKPGGVLILVDDVLSPSGEFASVGGKGAFWLQSFQWGWGVPNVMGRKALLSTALGNGFLLSAERDLTPDLRLRPLPAPVIKYFIQFVRRLANKDPYWRSVAGGQALQHCLQQGLVGYHYFVFKKHGI